MLPEKARHVQRDLVAPDRAEHSRIPQPLIHRLEHVMFDGINLPRAASGKGGDGRVDPPGEPLKPGKVQRRRDIGQRLRLQQAAHLKGIAHVAGSHLADDPVRLAVLFDQPHIHQPPQHLARDGAADVMVVAQLRLLDTVGAEG